ncbi:four helix bundle protein [Anaeromyxobacter terrae]|uniref:four helix bundle protein n=1 Tax=Anaeromyxobacter terrae TaxID=2925406 RepID=UPI0024366D7B|nr:four helix bundle protein [Anaeromyxobacter sp. SG22]
MTDRLAALFPVPSSSISSSPASSSPSSSSRSSSSSPSSSFSSSSPVLPHHKLIAFSVARDLLLSVLRCSIRDAKLRDEAVRSAKSACLNCAEGAGRVTRADKARAFAIARAEAVEAAAAVEIAALCGDTSAARADEVARVVSRLVGLLTGLVR